MAYRDFRDKSHPDFEIEESRPGIPSNSFIQRIVDEAARETGLPMPDGVDILEGDEFTIVYDKFRRY